MGLFIKNQRPNIPGIFVQLTMTESDDAPFIDQPILLFDGTCVMCNAFFQWILKIDKKKVFEFATIQSEFGQKIIVDQKLTEGVDSVILYSSGKAYIYSEAALRVGLLLGGVYKILSTVGLWMPKTIRDAVYKYVARHRYSWFGQRACIIPSPDVKARFKY